MCEEAGKLCGFSGARRRPRITQTNMSDELQKATCNSKPVCKQNSAVPRGCFKVFQRIRLQKRIPLNVSETRWHTEWSGSGTSQKAARPWSWLYLMPSLRIPGATPPLHHNFHGVIQNCFYVGVPLKPLFMQIIHFLLILWLKAVYVVSKYSS